MKVVAIEVVIDESHFATINLRPVDGLTTQTYALFLADIARHVGAMFAQESDGRMDAQAVFQEIAAQFNLYAESAPSTEAATLRH